MCGGGAGPYALHQAAMMRAIEGAREGPNPLLDVDAAEALQRAVRGHIPRVASCCNLVWTLVQTQQLFARVTPTTLTVLCLRLARVGGDPGLP